MFNTRRRPLVLLVTLGLAAIAIVPAGAAGAVTDPSTPSATSTPAPDAPVVTKLRFTVSDGTSLAATLTSQGPLAARPTVVEFTPYGPSSPSLPVTSDYNYLLVQDRGTGDSDGQFDVMGPRMQQDVSQVLQQACDASWSDGNLALDGFSASAIIYYNSLHLPLPCVKAAVMKSGTFDLYRDLLVPGGISNLAPAAVVLFGIGGLALAQGADRVQRNPLSAFDVLSGLLTSGLNGGLLHPTLDSWWQDRRYQGDVNKIPTLMIDGFYDVESRGAFQAFQALNAEGANPHLLVVGGHDGAPAGTDDGVGEAHQWLDHYLMGVDNGVQSQPAVQMMLADGDRENMLAGDFVRYDASSWPVPGTTWSTLHLDATKSGTATSLNDGSLTLSQPTRTATQTYPSIASLFTNTDPPNTAVIGSTGLNQLATALPILTNMNLAESIGLTYTTKPFSSDVLAAGPVTLDVPLSTTTPETGIWAVLSDVSPDGTSHPLTVGRLNTSFPNIDQSQSLYDSTGALVQPYGDYSAMSPAKLLQTRTYHVEFWPVGNRFKAGDRLRLDIVGASMASVLSLPAINSIKVGGAGGAVLRFPVLPGSNLGSALQ